MTANFQTVDQETLERGQVDGIYYGPKVQILARTGERLLLWIPGHSAWAGTGQAWRYEPSCLMVHLLNGRGDYRRLVNGGRLKAALARGDDIDRHFGEGFHKLLEPGKTVVAA